MTGQPGRPPGYPKSGGAKKGSIKVNTRRVKDTILSVFNDDLGGAKYLRKVAKNDPALFCSLLARLIPQEIKTEIKTEINVNHSTLDLGAAMADAAKNLALVYSAPAPAPFTDAQVIDHCPTPVTTNGTDNV